MIGSITKPMTTMLAAALVDDGHLSGIGALSMCCRSSLPYDAARPKSSDATRREEAVA